jgi:hypothetical protein
MRRNQQGFTLIEITAGTESIDLAAQTDRIQNQIRYTQAAAMKQYDQTLMVWGLKCNASPNQYWLFEGQNPDDVSKQKNFPGEQNLKISLADRGVDSMTAFTLLFDRFGRPYTAYTDEITNVPLASQLTITISAAGQTRTIRVHPETGLVQ